MNLIEVLEPRYQCSSRIKVTDSILVILPEINFDIVAQIEVDLSQLQNISLTHDILTCLAHRVIWHHHHDKWTLNCKVLGTTIIKVIKANGSDWQCRLQGKGNQNYRVGQAGVYVCISNGFNLAVKSRNWAEWDLTNYS